MYNRFLTHNRFLESIDAFISADPHLSLLSKLKHPYHFNWWQQFDFKTPGIYILTGGRQVGKSTSCKLLIEYCLRNRYFLSHQVFYLTCDEIFDAKELSQVIRSFLDSVLDKPFLLIIDEVTFVRNWDRVIKALADEGHFRQGLALLTGSDTLILKEAAMRFPGRRGNAAVTDFHLYPLSFSEYVQLVASESAPSDEQLFGLFQNYLLNGGYLRAINDIAEHGRVIESTLLTYEQWIRGDFLRHGKREDYLAYLLNALLILGVSQISYSALTQKIGLISKETCIEYCNLLERMDVLFNLQAFDQNKKQGFPKKARKFHFCDPFIQSAIANWLQHDWHVPIVPNESNRVEACVARHLQRAGSCYYFKGDGEIDVIWLDQQITQAVEVKWSNQIRPNDLKMLRHFKHATILTKVPQIGKIEGIDCLPVYRYLLQISK